jgi:CubicO group peptidase (beta-lactamase class C family)
MMGYILESVTGLSFEQVLDQLFFTPLQMKNTGVDLPRIVNEGRAFGHSILDGKLTNADNDRLSEIDSPGELYSTTGDLDKWCEALFSGKLLSQETMSRMFTPYYATTYSADLRYGYGWFLGPDYQWIVGGTPGFRSEIWYYPDGDLRVIMLWNCQLLTAYAYA